MPRKMDAEAAERIARALGPNDPASQRVRLSAQNNRSASADATRAGRSETAQPAERKSSSEGRKKEAEEAKQQRDKKTT